MATCSPRLNLVNPYVDYCLGRVATYTLALQSVQKYSALSGEKNEWVVVTFCNRNITITNRFFQATSPWSVRTECHNKVLPLILNNIPPHAAAGPLYDNSFSSISEVRVGRRLCYYIRVYLFGLVEEDRQRRGEAAGNARLLLLLL